MHMRMCNGMAETRDPLSMLYSSLIGFILLGIIKSRHLALRRRLCMQMLFLLLQCKCNNLL